MLVLISFTAISRFVKVWNAASGKDAVVRRRVVAWREGKVDSRWRTWREARESTGVPRSDLGPDDRRPGRALAGPPPGITEQPFGSHAPGAPSCHPGSAFRRHRRRAGPPAARRPRPDPEPAPGR